MSGSLLELRRDVRELRERDTAARAVAREASARTARWFAGVGLALTLANVVLAAFVR